MKDVIKISVVNFHALWGKKEENLNRIIGYIECAASEGTNLLVFPEMALTSYDDQEEVPWEEKMQVKLAETIPGAASNKIAELSKQYNMYIVFGMPEADSSDSSKVYNTACVCGPEGIIGAYRKMHVPYPEYHWATRGEKPMIFDTEWGPIGVAICYDTYCFPEIMRYYAAKGCRIHINPTAYAKCHGESLPNHSLRASAAVNRIFIVSSNLIGVDLDNDFWGGSSILGPDTTPFGYEYYVGHSFADDSAGYKNGMHSGVIDLALATRDMFEPNPGINGATDYRPLLYKAWMENLEMNEKFCKTEFDK